MGENRTSGEGILGGFVWKEVRYEGDDYLSIMQNIARLCSFDSDKLKCVQSRFLGYNKSKFNFNLEKGLMAKKLNGEKNYA
jgi:hypothetical protein